MKNTAKFVITLVLSLHVCSAADDIFILHGGPTLTTNVSYVPSIRIYYVGDQVVSKITVKNTGRRAAGPSVTAVFDGSASLFGPGDPSQLRHTFNTPALQPGEEFDYYYPFTIEAKHKRFTSLSFAISADADYYDQVRETGCCRLNMSNPIALLWGTVAVVGHFDNDNYEDYGRYDLEGGVWSINGSGWRPFMVFQWGDKTMIPVPGDYDGDGIYDLAVYQESTGNWYIRTVFNGPPITFGQNWGGPGMIPVPGDYNGDGIFDLAVYQISTGNWFIRSLGSIGPNNPPITFGQNWGNLDMKPVSGDYNGDGIYDLAVYQSGTGNWFIRSLGPIAPNNPPITFGQNWGTQTMTPVSGDFNGDGVYDLAVYDLPHSRWYIRSLGPISSANPPILFGEVWGAPLANNPVAFDYSGDGKDEIGVFDQGRLNWHIKQLGTNRTLIGGGF